MTEVQVPPQTPTLHFEPPSSFSIPKYCFYPLRALNVLFREADQGLGGAGVVIFWPEPFLFSIQLCEFVQKDELKPAVTQLLWERATEKVPCSPLERCSSVMLLGMMAR